MKDPKQSSREDDFRDFEQRDIRDGWPYADQDGDQNAQRNAPYGTSDTNLDQLDNQGVEVSTDPVARDVEGAPTLSPEGTDDVIEDDDLEERISETLESDGRIDLDSLEISVRDGAVHLEGSVDSEEDRRHLIGLIRRMKGVGAVHADALLAQGVDSHIPKDADE